MIDHQQHNIRQQGNNTAISWNEHEMYQMYDYAWLLYYFLVFIRSKWIIIIVLVIFTWDKNDYYFNIRTKSEVSCFLMDKHLLQ